MHSPQLDVIASYGGNDRSIKDGFSFVRTNCFGTNVLCDVARRVGVERFLHIYNESAVQRAFLSARWFIKVMNVYYGTLHFIITGGLLMWVYLRRHEHYRQYRRLMAHWHAAMPGARFGGHAVVRRDRDDWDDRGGGKTLDIGREGTHRVRLAAIHQGQQHGGHQEHARGTLELRRQGRPGSGR